MKEKGLDAIYTHFGTFRFKGKGHEISDLKKLIKQYQDWAYIMYPSMRFKDIVKKTETFSSKNSVKAYLQKLRDKRDGVNVMEEDEDIDLVMNDNDNNGNNNGGNNGNDDIMNNGNNRNNGLQRRPDTDFEAVVALRANRINDGDNENNNDNGNSGNNDNENVSDNDDDLDLNGLDQLMPTPGNNVNKKKANTNNNNNNGNYNNFWGDPFGGMDSMGR